MGKSKILGATQGCEMTQKNIHLPQKQWEDIVLIGVRRGISASDFIRESIQNNIKKYNHLIHNIRKPK